MEKELLWKIFSVLVVDMIDSLVKFNTEICSSSLFVILEHIEISSDTELHTNSGKARQESSDMTIQNILSSQLSLHSKKNMTSWWLIRLSSHEKSMKNILHTSHSTVLHSDISSEQRTRWIQVNSPTHSNSEQLLNDTRVTGDSSKNSLDNSNHTHLFSLNTSDSTIIQKQVVWQKKKQPQKKLRVTNFLP